MSSHALGRGLVAVPVRWIDALVPGAREAFWAVRARNRSGIGRVDLSGEQAAASILHLVSHIWPCLKKVPPPPTGVHISQIVVNTVSRHSRLLFGYLRVSGILGFSVLRVS